MKQDDRTPRRFPWLIAYPLSAAAGVAYYWTLLNSPGTELDGGFNQAVVVMILVIVGAAVGIGGCAAIHLCVSLGTWIYRAVKAARERNEAQRDR